jgi:CRISPR-associated protein Cmr1
MNKTGTPMKTREYTVRFLTPAFLGNAEQNAQWRTPPFKALLRQWWRVAVAEELKFNVNEIRKREAELFGVAADGGDSHKSRVRIRLDDWSLGKLNQAPAIGQVVMGKNQISAALYSGYGPVVPGPKLKANAAIQSGSESQLRIAFPEGLGVEQAIAWMSAYGTLGGRSRNGWGSFELLGEHVELKPIVRDWKTAMQMDWPHTLGKDDNTLIWQSSPLDRWEDAMKLLAQARADMRRAVPDRLMLAYPSTKGVMPGWKNTDRVPHSIRFKVRSEGKQFVAVIFHMPCCPASELWQKLTPQKQQGFLVTFAAAHAFLDGHAQFNRAGV